MLFFSNFFFRFKQPTTTAKSNCEKSEESELLGFGACPLVAAADHHHRARLYPRACVRLYDVGNLVPE